MFTEAKNRILVQKQGREMRDEGQKVESLNQTEEKNYI